jgi:hypothetical protein
VLERNLEEPPAKRKPGWLKEIVQEEERIVAPKGTFRERKRPHADTNLYFKVRGNQPVILILYVDDLFLTRDEGLIVWCKREITLEFEMKYLCFMHYFLGFEVWIYSESVCPLTFALQSLV